MTCKLEKQKTNKQENNNNNKTKVCDVEFWYDIHCWVQYRILFGLYRTRRKPSLAVYTSTIESVLFSTIYHGFFISHH
jgi:hypothetical protein